MILLAQSRINVRDSQPGYIPSFRLLDQLTEDFSSLHGLASPGIGVSEIATEVGRFLHGVRGLFHFRHSLIKPFLHNQNLSVAVVSERIVRIHIEGLEKL